MTFAFPPSLLAPLAAGLLIPLFLLPLARLPALAGRNPLQFAFAVLAAYAVWGMSVAAFASQRPPDAIAALAGAMTIGGFALFFLEVWGLMSRGYTLGVMLSLLRAGHPMTSDELAGAYRGGDGLDWIVHHRLSGLAASGIVRREGGCVALTSPKGVLVARLYRMAIRMLGLRRTG